MMDVLNQPAQNLGSNESLINYLLKKEQLSQS